MAKIKARELRKLSKEELNNKVKDLRKDLIKINAQRSTGTAVENPGKIKQVRKAIARIFTVMNEKPAKVEETKKAESPKQKKEAKNKQ